MTSLTSSQTIVMDLMIAAVPERAEEIKQLWRQFNPAIEVSRDGQGMEINANRRRIRFSPKSLGVIWLMGFNGWSALSLYSPAVLVSALFGLPIDTVLNADEERGPLEHEFRATARRAADLAARGDADDLDWPNHVPRPTDNSDEIGDVKLRAAFELTVLATAYVFFHELRHVLFDASGQRPATASEEEAACDVWARSFMTEKVHEYARDAGVSREAVMQKRSMALALGAAILHQITPESERWGSKDYPPIADRMHALVSGIGPTLQSHYWTFAACLLIGLYRLDMRPLPMVVQNEQDFVEELVEGLR